MRENSPEFPLNGSLLPFTQSLSKFQRKLSQLKSLFLLNSNNSFASPRLTVVILGRSSKGQHSAPRGGPPRSWTNDDLTKALENVWNKRMTTSQASRVFGIPYNSLLMYVRGKYGKSLRLDVLKKSTPAANDNLNTIGNSRSTPKEKTSVKKEDYKNEYSQHLAEVRKERNRKPSQDGNGNNGMPIFPFDQLPMNPFSNGLLQFPPGAGEPFGLLGLAGLPPGILANLDLSKIIPQLP